MFFFLLTYFLTNATYTLENTVISQQELWENHNNYLQILAVASAT